LAPTKIKSGPQAGKKKVTKQGKVKNLPHLEGGIIHSKKARNFGKEKPKRKAGGHSKKEPIPI